MEELSLEEAGTVRHRTVTWTDPLVGAALARDLSGLEYLRAIAEGRAPAAPIAALLGMSVVSVEKGQVTFGLDVGEHLYNPIGSVHGGVFCTLLDSAMGCAVHSSLDRGQAYTTLELKVNIVKALTLSTPGVVATGQVVSAGRRVATASGQITGPDGTLYAHATTTCLVFEPRGGKSTNGTGRAGVTIGSWMLKCSSVAPVSCWPSRRPASGQPSCGAPWTTFSTSSGPASPWSASSPAASRAPWSTRIRNAGNSTSSSTPTWTSSRRRRTSSARAATETACSPAAPRT